MGPRRMLRFLGPVVHRLDRLSGLHERRRRGEEIADRRRFAYEVGRRIGPVAERCGYGDPQISATHVTYCGDPDEILARHPWLNEEPSTADVSTDPGWCFDLHIGWHDGWVELQADPFVVHSLLAATADGRTLSAALEHVATQLADSLDEQTVVVGTSPWHDPRPSDGSNGYLQG